MRHFIQKVKSPVQHLQINVRLVRLLFSWIFIVSINVQLYSTLDFLDFLYFVQRHQTDCHF